MTAQLTATDPALLAFADEVGADGPVTVAGRRTRWDLGGAPAADTRIVTAPTGIVEHIPEEMIATVRCGTRVRELHAALAEKGQRTALPDRGGTVGGAIAVGEDDHRVLGRGALRTAVLQIRYISAEGKVITGGGPTVKNVTGFDLPRLMTGSLGTLGCLAEAILRTNPIPAVSRWYSATGADPFAAHRAVLAPSAVLWDGTTTWVQLEGHAPDVADQAAALSTAGAFQECDAPTMPAGQRWSLPPADLAHLDRAATGSFVALIGVGTLFAEKPQALAPLAPAVAALHDRVKAEYDPTGRLNPGRVVGTR